MKTHMITRRTIVFMALAATSLFAASAARAQASVPFDADGDVVLDSVQRDATSQELRVLSGASSSLIRTLRGAQTGEGFAEGYLVCPDINGDGVPDAIAVAPGFVANGATIGAVYAFSLSTGATIWMREHAGNGHLGTHVAWVPDQDRDGRPDLLVERVEAGAAANSLAVVVSGGTGAVLADRTGGVVALALWAHAGGLLYVPTDLDDSGSVNYDDVVQFVQWVAAADNRADLNGDNIIDADDVAMIIGDYAAGVVTVQSLASPPSGDGETGGPGSYHTDCTCGAGGLPTCDATTVTIVDCNSQVWIPGRMYAMRAEADPPGGTFTWMTDSKATLVSANGSTAIFACSATHPTTAMIRVRYDRTLPDGSHCKTCACCIQQVGCDGQASLGVVRWFGPILDGPAEPLNCDNPNVVPPPIVIGESQPLGVTAAGSPPGGTFSWRVVTTDPVGLPVDILQTGPRGETAIITPGEPIGEAVIEVGYSAPPACPKACRFHVAWSTDSDGDGIPDILEHDAPNCPDKHNPDTDGDGFSDGVELRLGTNPCDPNSHPDSSTDSDRDGLTDFEEVNRFHTDPYNFDTDDDGVQDYAEAVLGLDPLHRRTGGVPEPTTLDSFKAIYLVNDRDRDGIFDEYELALGMDPLDPDQDADGIRDGLELRRGLDPRVPDQGPASGRPWIDSDGDGLIDAVEQRLGTDPYRRDTDGDGVSDGNEARMGLNPNNPDSDYNGVDDGEEDFDGDGLSNAMEELLGTDPTNPDTDGDGVCDGGEVQRGTSPIGLPPLRPSPIFGPGGERVNCQSGEVRIVAHCRLAHDKPQMAIIEGHVLQIPSCVPQPPAEFPYVSLPIRYDHWYNLTLVGICPAMFQVTVEPQGCPYVTVQDWDWLTVPTECGGTGVVRFRFNSPFSENEKLDLDGDGEPDVYDTNHNGRFDDEEEYRARLNAHIDSDNNDGFFPPACTSAEDALEEAQTTPPQPGKILLADTWDTDGDNIPDYADGFDLLGGATTFDDDRGPVRFVPIIINVTGAGVNDARLVVNYHGKASPPDAAHIGTTGEHLFERLGGDAAGNLRLWAWVNDGGAEHANDRRSRAGAAMGSAFGAPPSGPLPGRVKPKPGGDHPGGRCDQPGGQPRSARVGQPGFTYLADGGAGVPLSQFTDYFGGRVTLYLEAIAASPTLGQEITFTLVNAPCDGSECSDTVKVTAVDRQVVPIEADGTLGQPSHGELPLSLASPKITPGLGEQPVVEVSNLRLNAQGELIADITVRGTVDDALSDTVQGTRGVIPTLGVLINGEIPPHNPGTNPTEVTVTQPSVKNLNPSNPLVKPWDFSGRYDQTLEGVPVQVGWNTLELTAKNCVGGIGHVQLNFNVQDTPPLDEIIDIAVAISGSGTNNVNTITIGYRRYHVGDGEPDFDTLLLSATGTSGVYAAGGVTVAFANPGPFDTNTADDLHATVTIPGIDVDAEAYTLNESGADSRDFHASRLVTEEELETWQGFTFTVDPAESTVSKQSSDPFHGFLLELVGPPNVDVTTLIDRCDFAGGSFTVSPFSTGGQTTRYFARSAADPSPMVFQVLPSRPNDPPPFPNWLQPGYQLMPWEGDGNGAAQYTLGVAEGTGKRWIVWHTDPNYVAPSLAQNEGLCKSLVIHSVRWYKSGSPLSLDERAALRAGGDAMSHWADDIELAFANVAPDLIHGDAGGALANIGFAGLRPLGTTVELLNDVRETVGPQWEQMTDREKGRVVGQVAAETTYQVGMLAAAGGTGAAEAGASGSEAIAAAGSHIATKPYLVRLFRFSRPASAGGQAVETLVTEQQAETAITQGFRRTRAAAALAAENVPAKYETALRLYGFFIEQGSTPRAAFNSMVTELTGSLNVANNAERAILVRQAAYVLEDVLVSEPALAEEVLGHGRTIEQAWTRGPFAPDANAPMLTNWLEHFAQHVRNNKSGIPGGEFPDMPDVFEYARMARLLLDNSSQDVVRWTTGRGNVRVASAFNKVGRTFAARDGDWEAPGAIRTYFRSNLKSQRLPGRPIISAYEWCKEQGYDGPPF